MKNLEHLLTDTIIASVKSIYNADLIPNQINFQTTRKEFDGDITLVVFPIVKLSKKSPEQTAEDLGAYLEEHIDFITAFSVIKGFLNLMVTDSYWLAEYSKAMKIDDYGRITQ